MLFKKNPYNCTSLLEKMLSGKRIIIVINYENWTSIKVDEALLNSSELSLVGLETGSSGWCLLAALMDDRLEKSEDDKSFDVIDEFFNDVNASLLTELGICKHDDTGSGWSDEEIQVWLGMVADQEINVFQKYNENDLIATQLSLIMGGEWHYQVRTEKAGRHPEVIAFYDSCTVYDDNIEAYISESLGEYTEWICELGPVHVYDKNPDYDDLYWYFADRIEELYGDMTTASHIELLLDNELSDEIIGNFKWDSSFYDDQPVNGDNLRERLCCLGFSNSDAMLLIASLAKSGIKVSL